MNCFQFVEFVCFTDVSRFQNLPRNTLYAILVSNDKTLALHKNTQNQNNILYLYYISKVLEGPECKSRAVWSRPEPGVAMQSIKY